MAPVTSGQTGGETVSPEVATASRSADPDAVHLGATHMLSGPLTRLWRPSCSCSPPTRTGSVSATSTTSGFSSESTGPPGGSSRDTANQGEIYRPLNLILTKTLFEIRGADFFVFRTAHLVTLGVLLLGWLKTCDPRTWRDVMRFAVATGCLLGLHTTRHLFHGLLLNPSPSSARWRSGPSCWHANSRGARRTCGRRS